MMIDEIIRQLEAERDKAEEHFRTTDNLYAMGRYKAEKWAYTKAINIVKGCSMDRDLKYNASGYYDPTAYKALRDVQKGEKHGKERFCDMGNGVENILSEGNTAAEQSGNGTVVQPPEGHTF